MNGKVAIVTGASSGIGLATAHKLSARGVRVAMVARREAAVPNGEAFVLDVRDRAALQDLPRRVVERFGRLDVVVNNAGVNYRGPMDALPAAHLAEILDTNLMAPVLLSRAAAPLMAPGGSIVNVASIAGMVPVLHEATYSASKAGLRAFSRVIREELEQRGIRVSLVSPGPVDTAFFEEIDGVPDLVFSQPMSTAETVADAILRAIETGPEEIAVPPLPAKLATLGYLSSSLMRMVRPLLEKRGARRKRAFIERKRAR